MPILPPPSPEGGRRLIAEQGMTGSRPVLEDRFTEEVVAGVDQAFIPAEGGRELVVSGAVALEPSLRVISRSSAVLEATFPY